MKKKLDAARSVGALALSVFALLGCGSGTPARSLEGAGAADARDGAHHGVRGGTDAGVSDAPIADARIDAADATSADQGVADATSGGWGVGGDGGRRPVADVVRDYVDAWSSSNEVSRRALLAASFTAGGEYTDSLASNRAFGREALVGVIRAFQANLPNARMTPTSGVDVVDNQFRFSWKVVLADGSTLQTGEDQGEVGSDGLIRRITGFFDPDVAGSTPAAISALSQALSDGDAASRSTDLRAAVAAKIAWGDRWMGAAGVTELEVHFNDWVPPGSGTFAIVGGVGEHDDRFRVTFQVSGGKVAANSQLFGHLDSGGLIDFAVFYDGDLPAP